MTLSLPYVPKNEFDRLLALQCSPTAKSRAFAACCRINTLYMIRKAGSGHIGSSFSSLDIVSWLLLHELQPEDIYFSSKGHDVPGLYAALTALGVIPFEQIHKLRRLGGLPGHPDVHTPGIPANTGSLGMGISKAKGMIMADRLAGRERGFYVLTGDGELQEGQIWESLASAVYRRMGELTVIVDHNKLQSDIWVHLTSDLGDLEAKFAAFGWHVQRIDGHEQSALAAALARAKEETTRPSVIIADTIKGKGVSFFEHTVQHDDPTLYRFHSGAPDMDTCRRAMDDLLETAKEAAVEAGSSVVLSLAQGEIELPLPPRNPQRLVAAYADALVEQGRKRKDLVVLDADLKLDCGLIPFEREFPERFIECGIAEQDMVSQAGGLALSGILPVVHSFACFFTPRANEQIYNNATEKTKIIYVGSLAGVLPGGPGHSHQSVRDISVLAAIPGLSLFQPSCEREVGMALEWAINENRHSTYLRLSSIPCEIPFDLPGDYRLTPGRGVVLFNGDDAVLFTYGPVMLTQALNAAELLSKKHGIGLRVVNYPWLNRIDDEWLVETIGGRQVLILDDHYTEGGIGIALSSNLTGKVVNRSVIRFGLLDVPVCGNNDEILRYHGLCTDHIVTTVLCEVK